ncbi:MAG: recombinase family protein [Herpetosiphonaceae bacterium]|nr:recombinase family protein [Herpetosiphonaceae bacterium]
MCPELVGDIYRDEGISGTLGPEKRPGLAGLLAAVDAGAVQAVIVLDLSRLARSVKLVTSMIESFDQAGISFVSCKENFDTSTAMGRAMLGIVAVFGQLERDLTSERTIAALGERDKQHGYKSGRIPLGYVRQPGQEVIEVDGQAATLVRQIFARRAAGASMQTIADELNSAGAAGRFGGTWYRSTVKIVLDNAPTYQGQHRHWPPLLAK